MCLTIADLSDKDADLGHGSHFAPTLGFYGELAWDDAMHGNSEYDEKCRKQRG